MPSTTIRGAIVLAFWALIAAPGSTFGQATTRRRIEPDNPSVKVWYGSSVTSSFTAGNQLHRYELHVENNADRVRITVKPTGDTLRTSIGLFDVADNLVVSIPALSNSGRGQTGNRSRFSLRSSRGLANPQLTSPSLSSDGTYIIEVYNGGNGVGRYQLLVEGLLSNGKVVSDKAKAPNAERHAPGGEVALPAVGFPGLPAVDFSGAIPNELPESGEIRGKITSDQDKVVRSYIFTPAEGVTCEVTLRRAKGSGTLGFVILSASNEVLAQSSLMASDKVITTLVFPKGAATLAVFRMDSAKGGAQWPTDYELKVKPVAVGRR